MKHFTLITSLLLMSAVSFAQFRLSSPATNANLKAEGLSSTPVNIGWGAQTTLTGTVTYTWHLDALTGNFTAPIVSVPSNSMGSATNLTLNYATVNAVLADAGVSIGDTARLKWTVTASNGSATIFSPDMFNINLVRGASIAAYDLTFPTNGFSATIEGDDKSSVDITWESAGAGANYVWFLDLASGNFSNPVVGPLSSNDSGKDTILSLDAATIDAVLAGAGLAKGQTANLQWKVHAYAGTDSIASTSSFALNLTRGTLLKDFDLVFPGNGFAATIEGKGATELDIRWGTSDADATYEWSLDLATGDFSNPLVTVPSNNTGMDTVLTLDFATINSVLSAAGVAIGGTANLKWRVISKTGTSEKVSNMEYTIDLTRGVVISPFMLSFPTDGFAATIDNDSTKELTVLWNNAGEGATYKWFLDVATGDYSSALVAGLASNNSGADTALTLRYSTIYAILSGAGVSKESTVNLKWKVHAFAGTDSIASGDYKIDLTTGEPASSVFDFSNTANFTFGPNPIRKGQVLNITTTSIINCIEIVGITGKQVELTNLEFGNSNFQIETTDFLVGLYIVNIVTENGVESRKLIVE